jgi:cytochrome oxidase Cu insertion factor (SCO1/SenC/PrrC family)
VSRLVRSFLIRASTLVGAALLPALGVACTGGTASDPPGGNADSSLRIGATAPSFTLPSAGGQDISLGDYRGEKPVLLYFSMGPG